MANFSPESCVLSSLQAEVFRITVSCQVQSCKGLNRCVLVARRTAEIKYQPTLRSHTEPSVVPAAVWRLIRNYPLNPSPSDFVWKAGPQEERYLLNVKVHRRNIKYKFAGYPAAKMLDEVIQVFIRPPGFPQRNQSVKLMRKFSPSPPLWVKQMYLLRSDFRFIRRHRVQNPFVVKIFFLNRYIQFYFIYGPVRVNQPFPTVWPDGCSHKIGDNI